MVHPYMLTVCTLAARSMASTSGASATDYKLAGTSVSHFQPTSGFLLPGSLK